MNGSAYLQWHYMIFLAPMVASAFLLLLSSLRLGGGHRGHYGSAGGIRHHGGAGVRHHTGGAAHRAHSGAARGAHRPAGAAKGAVKSEHADAGNTVHVPWATSFVAAVFGIGKAPAPLVAEMFCLCWGVAGLCANQQLLPPGTEPTLTRVLPTLGIALLVGLGGARLSAEILARLMPKDETAIVSRNDLFGLTGVVVYPVTSGGGRVHIYDTYRTLHDEACRVAPDSPSIQKGRHARVIDLDISGNLIVEEAPEPIRFA